MVKKATIKLDWFRLYPDDMSKEEIETTAYLVTCGVLEPYFNSGCCTITDIQIEDTPQENVQSEETETDRPEDV